LIKADVGLENAFAARGLGHASRRVPAKGSCGPPDWASSPRSRPGQSDAGHCGALPCRGGRTISENGAAGPTTDTAPRCSCWERRPGGRLAGAGRAWHPETATRAGIFVTTDFRDSSAKFSPCRATNLAAVFPGYAVAQERFPGIFSRAVQVSRACRRDFK
jgi:hypothetical protein